jgi:sulfur carrier protein ThiS
LEVDQDATVLQVMKQLGVPEGEVILIFVNGRHAKPDLHLAEGDEVALVPPIGGG